MSATAFATREVDVLCLGCDTTTRRPVTAVISNTYTCSACRACNSCSVYEVDATAEPEQGALW